MADIIEQLPQQQVQVGEALNATTELNSTLPNESQPFTDIAFSENNVELMEKISKAAKYSFLPADAEFLKTKNYLTSNVGVKNPVSMYDHLTAVIMKAIESKNSNLVGELFITADDFERFSSEVKNSHYAVNDNAPTKVKQVHEIHVQNETATTRLQLLQQNVDDSEIGEIPDIMELAALWEWAGVAFGKEDTFLLFLSIKKLVQMKKLRSVRLWGKIFGRDANYIIAEGELKEGVDDVDYANANQVDSETQAEIEKPEVLSRGPKPPKPKQFHPLAKELRQGANKYIYYVCNTVGGNWTRLPDVIPERLQEARKIQKYFTGNLSSKIESYPQFKGDEAQYLRCQIARISAATVVSPKGYYILDEEAEIPEDGVPAIVVNPEFEGIANEQLADISNWVHHIPYVLPQGRVVYEAPKVVKEPKDEEEEEAETKEETQEPESGPETLSPVSEDQDHGSIPAWSARICSKLSPLKFSPITLRSNRWPGAFTLAYNDKFSNLYIGDGLKDFGNPAQNFLPVPLPAVQKEFTVDESSPETLSLLTEQIDPSIEDEKKYEESKNPPVENKPDADAEDAEEESDDGENKEEE